MLDKQSLTKIIQKLYEQSKVCYDELNAADGKIGDGDLGITILHGLEELITIFIHLQKIWVQIL